MVSRGNPAHENGRDARPRVNAAPCPRPVVSKTAIFQFSALPMTKSLWGGSGSPAPTGFARLSNSGVDDCPEAAPSRQCCNIEYAARVAIFRVQSTAAMRPALRPCLVGRLSVIIVDARRRRIPTVVLWRWFQRSKDSGWTVARPDRPKHVADGRRYLGQTPTDTRIVRPLVEDHELSDER